MDEKEKLSVLKIIAHAFDAAGITWALGASCFLYLKGVVPSFHDLDFVVAEEDGAEAEALLTALAPKLPKRQELTPYRTKRFAEYVIDGVDVDLMAGFSILFNGLEYPFPLSKASIVEISHLEGEPIPFESLAIWRQRYALMGRTSRVSAIDAYLSSH